MSKQSRARAAAKSATSAKASAASGAPPSPRPDSFLARWDTFLAGGVIVLAALAAYHNSFSGPFILDDPLAITGNPTIKHLGSALLPPASATTAGRPVLNLTFALNYAFGGMNVWGYHAFNLLIHTLAGLTLFGIVRRTLECGRGALTRRATQMRGEGTPPAVLALAVAVIWVVHPVQTEAVTYISQRAESLMGLFYLLTLYCFIRGASATGERREAKGEKPEGTALALGSQLSTLSPKLWFPASILSCFLGTMSKEMIATAPVMVLLYDRTFVAGSFREAWRLRWRYYLGLACTWLLLARLMIGLGERSVGFDQGVTWWSYALTSCRSVVLYGKLAFWPHPLVFDYGPHFIQHAAQALPYALVLTALLVGTSVALWRWPTIGFAGAWFFIILAPTSSVVPVAKQPMAEHRLYLSLAAVSVLGVLALYRLVGRRGLVVCAVLAAGLGWLSVQRNNDYRSEQAIWSDTVAKRPDNERAHASLGVIFLQIPGRLPDAIAEFQTALRIKPDEVETHNDMGDALSQIPGRLSDAMAEYQTALRINPNDADAHYNLGNDLLRIPGRLPEAIAEFQAALQVNPDYEEAHNSLGYAFSQAPGRMPDDAIAEYQAALRINPDYAQAHNNLGIALARQGHLAKALTQFEDAVRIAPKFAEVYFDLGNVFIQSGRFTDALGAYKMAVRLNPDYIEAHFNLGNTLAQLGRLSEAVEQYETTLRLKPDHMGARKNLERAQKMMTQPAAGSEK
jgi:tetratricopeptide (TPR) repeat protein